MTFFVIVIDITTVIKPLKDYSASCTVSLKVRSLACKKYVKVPPVVKEVSNV